MVKIERRTFCGNKRVNDKLGGEKAWKQHMLEHTDDFFSPKPGAPWPDKDDFWPETPVATVLGFEVPNPAPIAAACFHGLNGSFRGHIRLEGNPHTIPVKWAA